MEKNTPECQEFIRRIAVSVQLIRLRIRESKQENEEFIDPALARMITLVDNDLLNTLCRIGARLDDSVATFPEVFVAAGYAEQKGYPIESYWDVSNVVKI